MSSFRSHLRHHLQHNDPSRELHQSKQPSRAAARNTNAEFAKQTQVPQQTSRLAKRTSRNAASIDSGAQSFAMPAANQALVGYSKTPPVATSHTTSDRHHMLPPPSTMMRTPSLVSGSSASTFDSPRSSALRRKPSGAIDRYAAQRMAEQAAQQFERTAMNSRSEAYPEDLDDSVLGLLPPSSEYKRVLHDYNGDMEEQPNIGIAFNVTPPIPSYALSATPSTRYTDSPFSHVPTPSSVSSYSSSILATSATSARQRPSSPSRNRSSLGGATELKDDTARLAPVRESSTSSSNKTVRPSESKSSSTTKQALPRKVSTVTSPNKTPELRRQPSRNKLTKEQPLKTSKRQPEVPPELAHLNVDLAPKQVVSKTAAPARPSRNGTLNLSDMNKLSPVIQSDLPRLVTTYHKRTPSQDTPVSASSPSLKTRFGLSSRTSSRTGSPRVDSAISPPPMARTFARGPTPDLVQHDSDRLQRRDSPAVLANTSPAKTPRFGFFSRKSKSDGPKVTEKPKRQATKGPAAGTGHEGYGRFGFRGRSGSTSSGTSFRSPSTDSSTSSAARPHPSRKGSLASKDGSDMDDFLKERLAPVILRGSGVGSIISTSTLSSDSQGSALKQIPSNTSIADNASIPRLLPSAMQKSQGMSPSKKSGADRSITQNMSSGEPAGKAARRSSARLSQLSSISSTKATSMAPSRPRAPLRSDSIDSYDAGYRTGQSNDGIAPANNNASHGQEGFWLRSGPPEPARKPSRKFPFSLRANASPRSKGKERAVETNDAPSVPAHQVPLGAVAHYAMLDPVEPVGLDEVEQMAQESESSPYDSVSETNVPAKMVPYESRHRSLLPSPPKSEPGRVSDLDAKIMPPRIKLEREDSAESQSPELLRAQRASLRQIPNMVDIPRSPHGSISHKSNIPQMQTPRNVQSTTTPELRALSTTPEGLNAESSPRQSRLSPVGRIPRVVSKRDRERKLSDNSFSRPFARTQPRPSVKPPGSVYTQIREMASPIEYGSQPFSSSSTRSDGNSAERRSGTFTSAPSVSTNRTSVDALAQSEFFAFTPRKNSDMSYSSSSGTQSWLATAHAQPLHHDDIWTEYNDLMDEVMPTKTPTTASSYGDPFYHSSMLFDTAVLACTLPPLRSAPPQSELPLPPGSAIVPTVLSVPQQIARFLQPSMSPMTPDTLSAFVGGYGNRSTSTLFSQNRVSTHDPSRSSIPRPDRSSLSSSRRGSVTSSCGSRSSMHSRSSSMPEKVFRNSQSSLMSTTLKRTTRLLDIDEVGSGGQASIKQLRCGALITSKWLTFGQLLVSPAHNEMQLAESPRILVIDGLSSDWSYYVAVSYPSATVCNLRSEKHNAAWPVSEQEPPQNHKQYPFAGISAATQFPFPKGFFNAVVFRFPIVTTEQAYQSCISECKRVLRPGGYLEIAVLDLDLMNMGNKARKAVRDLKTRIHQRDRDICLSNLSDVIPRLIGRRGFEDIRRCALGIPAAGRIPGSQENSSTSSDGSVRKSWQREVSTSIDQRLTFTEVMKDAGTKFPSIARKHDESITKMAAKVGRWWYSTCYERGTLSGDQSIWSDRSLLRECEAQGSSFRLWICHAQKPTQLRRRTVSV